jgi:hypothetical protein
MKDIKRGEYSYLIQDKPSYKIAAKLIPVLIRLANTHSKPIYYGEIVKEINYKSSQIGYSLGIIDDIFKELSNKTKKGEIPTVNIFCVSKKTNLPSNGFHYVFNGYDILSQTQKEEELNIKLEKAYQYNYNWVLNALGLEPSIIDANNFLEITQEKFICGGGESSKHKRLKEYIYNNPEFIGIKNVVKKEMEYNLLSGDRLDVYFELKDGTRVAVEVKSYISDENDIVRGLFQCIKYNAVLEAENRIKENRNNYYTILVMENNLSKDCLKIKNSLNINVVENIEIKNN